MKNSIKKIMAPTKNLAAIIALLGLLLCCANTSWGQTSITVPNGDFSANSATESLSGSNPYAVTGWTITQNGSIVQTASGVTSTVATGGNAAITVGSSGVVSGALKFTGTNSTAAAKDNLNQAALNVESSKIDISSYAGSTTSFTYSFQIKVGTKTDGAAPWNVNIRVYDLSFNDITATALGIQAKTQGNLKTTPAGTYFTASDVASLTGTGTAPAYISIQLHLGQILANTPTVDNFTLTAAGAAASTTLVPPGSTALSYTLGEGPSASQSFTVAGANLGTNNITVAPGANIELSSDNSTFASSTITLTPTSGTVATTTFYARLIAGLGLGTGGSGAARQVNVNAIGTTTKTIQFTGSINGFTTTNPASTALSYNFGSGPSAEQSYSVQGNGLTSNLVITAGSNMEVSTTSGSGFSSSVTLTPASGVVAATTVYVRLKAGLAAATYSDATTQVVVSSTGFNDVTKQFDGNVFQNVTSYYYNGTGLLSSNTSWGVNTDGTGANPTAVTDADANFVITNGPATTNAAWTLGLNSKVIVGNGSAVTLTVDDTFPIIGTIDAAANGSVVWQHVLSSPTFGTLDNASEVHFAPAVAASYIFGATTAYGKLFIDGAGEVSVFNTASTPTVKIALTVASGSTLSFSSNQNPKISINSGATATINGKVITFRETGLFASTGSIPLNAAATLVLGATSTIEFGRPETAQTVTGLPSGVSYANLILSDGGSFAAADKTIAAPFTVNGTLTINLATPAFSTISGATNITMADGATVVMTSGVLGATPTFAVGSKFNVTYNGNGKTQIIGSTTASSTTVILASSNAAIVAGMTVTGTSLAAGTTVASISGTALVLSAAAITTSASPTLTFGTAVPQTSGLEIPSSNSALNNLTIENTAGVTLGTSTTINGTLTLTKGKLTLPASATLGIASGNAIVGGSSTNYIVADPSSVVRMDAIASERLLPIGNATKYLPITITPASTESLNISVFEGITDSGTFTGTAFTVAQKTSVVDAVWNISLADGSAATNSTVKVEWPALLEGADYTSAAAADLGLISNSGTGGWNSPTGSVDKTNRSATATVTSFGSFSVGRAAMLFAQPATKIYGDADFSAGVTSLNTSAITYVSNNLSVATVDATGIIHIVGAGTATITASQITDGVYAVVSISRTLTVDKAALTITADDQQKFLLAVNPPLTATYTGFKLGETEAVLLTPLVLTTTAVTSSAKGSYPITASGATAANYSISFVDGSLRVLNAAFEFDVMPVKNFGDADFDGGAFSVNTITPIEYVSDNTAVATIVAGKIHIVAVGTANITASQQGSGVYPSYTITQLLTVNKAPLTISFAALPIKVYGDADFSPTATSTNSDLSIVYSSSNASVASIVAGKIHIVGAGSCIITASQAGNANYASATNIDQALIIDKATLSITADNKSKYVGQANPALTYIYSGFVLGETATVLLTPIEISTTAVTASAVGTYPITVFGATANNYSISLVDATLTVKEKEIQTITFEAPATKTYGNANFAAGGSSSNASIAVVYSSSNKAVATIVGSNIHIVGTGTTDITASQAGSDEYEAATSVVRTLTVGKAALKITAEDKSKITGQVNPVLTVTYTGFVLSETSAVLQTPVVISTTAVTASLPGTYPITASAAASANYTISFVAGTLTVNPKTAQTISFAAPAVKNYGNADFAAGATSTNATLPILYSSSNQGVATVIGNMIHIVGAGTTVITASQNGDALYNPALNVSRTLTVSKVPLTIKATDTTKIQGEDNPVFVFSYTGLVAGETGANLFSKVSTSAMKGSTAGYYSITPTGADTSNYIITYVSGRFTIYPPSGKDQISLNAYRSGSSQLTLQIYSTQFIVTDAILYNLNGTPIKSIGCNVPKGFSTTKMDLPFLLPGLYIIKVKGWATDCKKIISIL